MADIGKKIREIEVTPKQLPVPQPVTLPAPSPVQVPA